MCTQKAGNTLGQPEGDAKAALLLWYGSVRCVPVRVCVSVMTRKCKGVVSKVQLLPLFTCGLVILIHFSEW